MKSFSQRLYITMALLFSFACVEAQFFDSQYGRFSVSGDYLLMRMQQEGLSYGSVYRSSIGQASPVVFVNTLDENYLTFPFRFDSGFRIKLGFEEPSHRWGVKATYDYLSSCVQGSVNGSVTFPVGDIVTSGFNNPVNFPTTATAFSSSLSADWKAFFNQLDLVVDRKFDCFRNVGINFILGLRLASIQQFLNSTIDFDGSTTAGAGVILQTATQVEMLKTRFKGIGPVTGFELRWSIWDRLSLYGFAKAALLYSKCRFSLHGNELQIIADTDFPFVQYKFETYKTLKPALDLGIGFEYLLSFCNDRMLLSLHTGWEHHQYWNQNFFRNGYLDLVASDQTDHPGSGDFSLYGWTIGADLCF